MSDDDKLFFLGIKGLIEDEKGRILLLKASLRDHLVVIEPYWDIPGGRIQEGHGPLETLSREIEEETGVKKLTSAEFFTAVISNHEVLFNNQKMGIVLFVYKVKIPKNSDIKISREHTKYEWLNKKDVAKRLAHKYPAEFTQKLLADSA